MGLVKARLQGLTILLLSYGLIFTSAACTGSSDAKRKPHSHSEKASSKSKPELIVYTYSSFMSAFGPGPEIAKGFEEYCQCKVRFVNAGDSGLILQRMKIVKSSVDVVIGLDQFRLYEAIKAFDWEPIDLGEVDWRPEVKEFSKSQLVPFDWSPLGIISRKLSAAELTKIGDLLKAKYLKKISLPDPHGSSPGLQFLVHFSHGKGKAELLKALKRLRQNLHSLSPSWSSSYGIFKSGQADLTYSYQTSLLYHWKEEKDKSFIFSKFANGHPVQVEFVGVPKGRCTNCELAKRFVRYLLSEKGQRTLYNKNYMLPVNKKVVLDEFGQRLSKVKVLKNDHDYFSLSWDNYKNSLIQLWKESSSN